MDVLNLLIGAASVINSIVFGNYAVRLWRFEHRYVSALTSGLFSVVMVLYSGYFVTNARFSGLLSMAIVLMQVVVALFTALQFRAVAELVAARQRLRALAKALFASALAILTLSVIAVLPSWVIYFGGGLLLIALISHARADKLEVERDSQMKLAKAHGLLDETPIEEHANNDDARLARIVAVKDRPAIEC